MADRRHHHHNHHLDTRSSSSNKNGGGSASSVSASASASASVDAAVDAVAVASSSPSKENLKLFLKLPNKSHPASPSSDPYGSSSSSSDPYGSSPLSHHFPHHHRATSNPFPKPSSVTSAPKKILSSIASLPTSYRSALPLPAVVAAPQVRAPTVASAATTSVPHEAALLAPATGALSTPASAAFSSHKSYSVTSASLSAFVGDDEGEDKPSKKRRLKSVVDSQPATVLVPTAHQLHQGEPLHAARLGLISQTSSGLPVEKLHFKGKGTEVDTGAEAVAKLTLELNTQPLLTKKVLEGIVEKLQRKDTYGVFSEPVDPIEVPDYYDIIKDPMDFGTMRKKIAGGGYASLELFQKDIFLICSNAMRYNARDTVYYKQARSIQDTARRALEALKTGTIIDEEQNVLMKQRPGGLCMQKSWKKPPSGRFLFEPTGSDYTSGATLATGGESGACFSEIGKGGKGLTPEKSGSTGWNPETQTKKGFFGEDQQDELTGSLSKSVALKDGRRLSYDENCRSTYKHSNIQIFENGPAFPSAGGERVHLVPMGYQREYTYARSLARFAVDLGPAVWRVAAEKIQKTLPPGLPFGPGWVGEQEAPAGVHSQHSNIQRAQLSQQMQMKGIQNTNSKQLDLQVQVTPVKFPVELQRFSASQVIPYLALSVAAPGTICQPIEEPMATINCSISTTEPAESTKEPSIARIQLSAAEPIKLSLGRADFATEVSQSKLLEMVSLNSRLVPWSIGRPTERDSLSASQSRLYSTEQSVHDRTLEGHDNAYRNGNISSSAAAVVADYSKHVFMGQGGRGVWSGSSQDFCLQNSSPADRQQVSQAPLKQTSHVYLTSTPGTPSLAFSSVDAPSIGAASGSDDRRMQAWACSQPIDLSHTGSNGRASPQNLPPGNTIQNQLGGASHFTYQQHDTQTRQLGGASHFIPQHDTQTRLGRQQHEYQARIMSQQHDNQRLSSVPQFLHHQFPNDTPSFVQQELFWLHNQGSSKPFPALIHSGGLSNSDLQDSNFLNLQSGFSTTMVAGVPPSLNQPWRFVSLQYPLQQVANLSHSLPPDLNVSLQTPKSPLDQASNSLTDSQQPDLALQL